VLVVGVNSDEEILRTKGPSILTTAERSEIIRSCRWVDEVAEGTEYSVSTEILDRYSCDFYAHGDDACIDAEGNDLCKILEDQGRFRMFKRTPGVSTTDIIGKLLTLVRENKPSVEGRPRTNSTGKPMKASEYVEEVRKAEEETFKESNNPNSARDRKQSANDMFEALQANDPLSKNQELKQSFGIPQSNFLATTRRIMSFSARKEPGPNDKVVYLHGSFDCLHNGHIKLI